MPGGSDSEEVVVANYGDSAHAGDSAEDPWALFESVIDAVVDLAQSSMPTVDSPLNINASMMLNPNLIQEGENGTESVSYPLNMIKETCAALAQKLESD